MVSFAMLAVNYSRVPQLHQCSTRILHSRKKIALKLIVCYTVLIQRKVSSQVKINLATELKVKI